MPKRVRKFRTADEIETRQALIQGEGQDIQAPDNLWSVSALKNLTTADLLSRLQSIDNQYTIMKWRIWWAIRQHFSSDKLFGQYLNELRQDSAYASCVGSQHEIHRAYCAGKFCEKNKINSLADAKVPRSAIYELSRPANEDIGNEIYDEIKRSHRRRFKLDEVERLIEQKKAVLTIEKAPVQPVERVEYGGEKRVIQVEDGIAQTGELLEHYEDAGQVIEHNAFKPVQIATMQEAAGKAQVFEYSSRPAPFSEKTTDEATNDQIADEIMAFVARHNLRWDRLIAVFQLCIEKSRVLPKR
jgi:hypothetical protein